MSSTETALVSAEAAVKQAAANSHCDAHDIRDPVVYVGAAIEAGLDEFNHTAEGTRADEDGQQTKAARARQREGQRREGDEVHEFVRPLGCEWMTHRPEHRDA